MEIIKESILVNLASHITKWIIKESIGNSDGILVGINSSLFSILNVCELDFTITILLQNKFDNFSWLLTFVYGPVLSNKKTAFFSSYKKFLN
jgi:hypothetical protein